MPDLREHGRACRFYNCTHLLHRRLSVTADSVTSYLNALIDRGSQAVMIFDT